MMMENMENSASIENEENMEVISCQIIAASGGAKSSYIEAIGLAKEGKFEEAEEMIREGAKIYLQGHKAHADLLQMSAEGKLEIPLLLMHAEDQMMNCETMKIVAEELIAQYKKMEKMNREIELLKGYKLAELRFQKEFL